MIEVFNKKKKRIGFIEGRKYFDKKHRLIGYLEGNVIKNQKGRPLLKLDSHDDIIFNGEQVGFILDSKIYIREEPIFEVSKEKREIHSNQRKNIISLKGNHQKIEDLDYFGIAAIYFEYEWTIKLIE